MLLKTGPVPSGGAWTFEIKWNGCRAQLRHDGRSVSLRTRNGRECSADFPELADLAGVLGKRRVTLDGELVCLRSDGRPDFSRLRRRLSGPARTYPAMLQVFDLLHLDGRSTRSLPYRKRRALLDEVALDGPAWRTPASIVVGEADEFVSRVADLGMEGVVAKRLDSVYAPGRRSAAWVKHKLRREEQLAVTGARRSQDGRLEALFVARQSADGSFVGAGLIELGLRGDLLEVLERQVEGLPNRRRGAVTRYPPSISVAASCHGLPSGPVRDAVPRAVVGKRSAISPA
jgi:bifunctional non-homologous end joining protein LigD